MVTLRFEAMSPEDFLILGPAPWFRISGNYIRQGPHGEIVGTFLMHHWEVQARHFIRFSCKDPSIIHFEDMDGGPTKPFGPFKAFQAADGVLYADGQLIAKFLEEQQLWHCFPTENFWPVLVIRPANQIAPILSTKRASTEVRQRSD